MKRFALVFVVLLLLTNAAMAGPLRVCSDTPYTAITGMPCGGDVLTGGHLTVESTGEISVAISGTHQFNLYEVYWVAAGSGSVTSAQVIGHFVTDCGGQEVNNKLLYLDIPAGLSGGIPVNIHGIVGPSAKGYFLIYSRGPGAFDDNGDCIVDDINTKDGTMNTQWGGQPIDLSTAAVQYIAKGTW